MIRFAVLVTLFATVPVFAQKSTREQKVREDKAKVEADGYWIYNDLPKAFAEAKQSGKPIVVVLRCIPCEECVKLDDDLVNTDPVLRPLLDRFVRVRVVSTNGLDLALFQFDTDQSFAAFLLNADGTVYGRFGTRSNRTNWVGDVSLVGLAKALRGALDLHADFEKIKPALAGKRGPVPEFPVPERFPTLKAKYTDRLNYSGNVVQSCIHCHQIGDAERDNYRSRKEPIPEAVLFPYPHPSTIGLILDPKEKATVKGVSPDSPAAAAGFRAGDAIRTMGVQPLLSIADVQWVLHTTPPEGGSVAAEVVRGTEPKTITLTLPKRWRQGDISWRSSSWGLRRMATGGLLLEEMTPDERAKAGVPSAGMALRVKHVGQYGPHAAAKNAGFKTGDVIVEFDGRTDLTREADVLAHGVTTRKPGEKVKVQVLRGGQTSSLTLPMQQ